MSKQIQLDENGKRKFGFMDKLTYAAGDFGCNMSFALKGTVNTFWLVYMCLETGLFSALLLAVQIWDAINDPLIGSIIDADRRKYRMGKFKTYILIGAIGLLVAGALVFIPVKGANDIIKSIVFIVGYVIWDAFYTIANVPYGSMLSLITTKDSERAQLSTWRSLGSVFGNMLPMVILPMIIWRDKVDENGNPVLNPETGKKMQELLGERVFIAALLMGVLGFIAFMFMIRKTEIRVDENSVKVSEKAEKFNVLKAFGNFMKNRPAVGTTLAAMGMFIGMNASATATQIMFSIHFEMAELSGVVTVVGMLPMFIFMPFIKKIVEKWGKKESASVGAAFSLLGGVLMFIFPALPPSAGLVVFIAALMIFGLGLGVYTCVSWAMMGDAIDYNDWKTGKREEGTVYALHSFFRKLAQGLGPSAVILIMGYMGYNSKLEIGEQTAQTAQNMCWLVAALWFISAVMMFVGIAFIYNLDKKTTAKMQEELRIRNEQAEKIEA